MIQIEREKLEKVLKAFYSMKETLAENDEPTTFNEDEAITIIKDVLAQKDSEPVVVVDRLLALRTWGFLAQECSPCAHEECQIEGKNFGVDTLCDAWNKTLDGTFTSPQRKPLAESEIRRLWSEASNKEQSTMAFIASFVRSIEAAHGIFGDAK